MQTTHAPIPLLATLPVPKIPDYQVKSTEPVNLLGSPYVIEEINAYAAIRDDLLAEAEEVPTRAKLDSVKVANDFVATCLQPPKTPYQTQQLPEADAAREQKRCREVTNRIVELRGRLPTGYPV